LRAATDRRQARQVVREEWRAKIRADQVALKERALQRAQAEIADREAAQEAARARRAVPRSVRMAHSRAQLFPSERLRVQLYLRPEEVAALHEWFERRRDPEVR